MPLPDLETLCAQLTVTPQRLTVIVPGGASLDPELPDLGPADPMRLAKQLLAQANAALAPLGPVFDLLDVALALVETIKAIPDAISHLDPGKITDALPQLVQKAAKLAPLVPQLSVPLMVVGLIDTLLAFLDGLTIQLRALIGQQSRIQRAADRAASLGNAQLRAIADCSRHHVDTQLQGLSESLAPVNRFIALLNALGQLAGLGSLPTLSDLGADPAAALQPIADTAKLLQQLRAAIPV
jgi:hypothetical protein